MSIALSKVVPVPKSAYPRWSSGSPVLRFSGSPVLRFSGSPVLRFSGSPVLRFSGSPVLRFSGSPVLRFSGSPVLRFSGSPVLRFSGSPVLRFSGSPVLRFSGSPVLRFSGSPVLRFSGSPVLRFSGSPVLRYLTFNYITIPPVRSSCGGAVLRPRRDLLLFLYRPPAGGMSGVCFRQGSVGRAYANGLGQETDENRPWILFKRKDVHLELSRRPTTAQLKRVSPTQGRANHVSV